MDESSGGYRLIGLLKGGKFIVKADVNDDEGQYSGQTYSELRMLEGRNILKRDRQYFPEVVAMGTHIHKGKTFCWLIEPYHKFNFDATVTSKIEGIMCRLMDRYDLEDIGWPIDECENWACANWAITPEGNPFIYDFGINRYGLDVGESMYKRTWPRMLAKK